MAFDTAAKIIITAQDNTAGAISSASAGAQRLAASYSSLLRTLGAGLSIGYFASLIKETIDAADRLNDLTQSLGINMQELAKYKLATDQSGSSLEGLGKGIKGLTNAFAEHGDELRSAGITAKTADGQIRQIAEIFSKMPDGLEKTTLATKLFGKSGMELIPMLNMGATGLDEAAQKSAQYAAVMGELGPRADKFNDSMAELAMASKVMSMSLINDALPAMTDIAKAMAVATHESGSLMAAWVGLGGVGSKTFDFLTVLISGFGATLQGLNANMLQFFGDTKGADYARASEERMYAKIRELTDEGSSAPAEPKKFDTAAWTEQYKKLIEALGIGKKATEDSDSAYRNLLKTLKEKLLVDQDLTEVNKLQLALDALSEKQRETITPAREKELKVLAAQVDLNKRNLALWDNTAKNEEALAKMREEGAQAQAAFDQKRGEALIAAYKSNDQMEFETTLIGKTNAERETAIALRALENSEIDKQSESYARLREKMKDAIAAKNIAEEGKRQQVEMWQSIDRTAHDTFTSIFQSGKSAFDRLRDTLKNGLYDLLYQMTIKKWMIQVVASTAGAGVAQSAFGSNSLSLLSSASNSGLFSMGLTGMADYAAGFATTATASQAAAAAMIESGTAGFAGAGMEAGAASMGFSAAIPYVGAAVLAMYALGVFDSDERQKALIGTGVTGKITSAGLTGSLASNWGTGPNDRWGGTTLSELPAAALATINNTINNVFTNMSAAAQKMGLSVADLSGIVVDFTNSSQNGDQTVNDLNAALAATSDAIALKLIPNIQSLQYQGETLTQTFARLSAAQAALDAQRRTMEIALMEAQGKTIEALAAKREDELAALDPTLRALQNQIYAAQDLTNAANDATGAVGSLAKQLSDVKTAAAAAVDAQIQSSRSAGQAARQAADAYRQVGVALSDAMSQILGGGRAATGARLAAVFSTAMTGDLGALSSLPKVAQDYLAASQATSRTASDFARDQAKVVGMLNQAQIVSAAMVNWNEYHATLLETQTGVLEAIKKQLALPSPDASILTQQMDMLGTIAGLLQEQTTQIVSSNRTQALLMQDQTGKIIMANTLTTDQTGQVVLGNSWLSQQAALLGAGNATLGAQTGAIVAAASVAQAQAGQVVGTIGGQTAQIVNGNLILRDQSGLIISSNAILSDQAGKIALGNALVGTQTGQIITGNATQDAIKNISSLNTSYSEEMLKALVIGGSTQTDSLQGIVNSSGTTVSLLRQLIDLTALKAVQDQAAAQAAAAAAAAAEQQAVADRALQQQISQATSAFQAQKSVTDVMSANWLAAERAAGATVSTSVAENVAANQRLSINWSGPVSAINTADPQMNAYFDAFAQEYALWKAIPGHAAGGIASGWSIVGEHGQELVNFTQPGRVYTAEQTRGMLSGSANDEVVSELRALRQQNERMQSRLDAMGKDTRKTAETLTRVTRDGDSLVTVAA